MAIGAGAGWTWARRAIQLVPMMAILVAPFLGGWQRIDRANLAMWEGTGFDLDDGIRNQLPLGDRPRQAYESLRLVGGGVAAEYVDIPAVDPVAGLAVVLRGELSVYFAIALMLPLLLALVAGRAFCGWMCPFGIVSRGLSDILRRLPWRPPALAIPARRWLRWVVMAASIGASVVGAHVVLFAFLPHLLAQQTVYAMWLLGGGGAVLGVFAGLVIAGLILGPTVYCATICPTGAALSLPARRRLLRVTLADPHRCGTNCTLCDSACWLQLEPSTGDPGPDCDTCARCFAVCPRANLRITARKPLRRHLPVVVALALAGAAMLGERGAAANPPTNPELVLNGEVERNGVTVALSVIDPTGVERVADWAAEQHGVELSVYVARGPLASAEAHATLPVRDVYTGPLEVDVNSSAGRVHIAFEAPTSPVSTPRRSIYRRTLALRLHPGDAVTVAPIQGWTTEPTRWIVPDRGVAPSWRTTTIATGAAAFVFLGLMMIALSGRPPRNARAPRSGRDAQPVQRV